jgi:hypothetical protein
MKRMWFAARMRWIWSEVRKRGGDRTLSELFPGRYALGFGHCRPEIIPPHDKAVITMSGRLAQAAVVPPLIEVIS